MHIMSITLKEIYSLHLLWSDSNPLSEESCKSQVWVAPGEQLTSVCLDCLVTESPSVLLYSLLTCDWLTSRHKASDWLICDSWDLYHRIKTSTWMILFLLQHAVDGCCNLQKKSFSFILNYISKEGCKRILRSSWIGLNRSHSLWQDWALGWWQIGSILQKSLYAKCKTFYQKLQPNSIISTKISPVFCPETFYLFGF